MDGGASTARIRFLSPVAAHEVRVEAGAPGARTLLAVARKHGVPILFNCEAGACGACAVTIEGAGEDGPDPVPLTQAEIYYLLGRGRLTVAEMELLEEGRPATIRDRLACQYIVGDRDIVVCYGTDLKGR
jgi:hypothetical protein